MKTLTELFTQILQINESEFIERATDIVRGLTSEVFSSHPEIIGVLVTYKVPNHDWNDNVDNRDLTKTLDDQEQDVSLPHVLLPLELTNLLAIPRHVYKLENKEVAVVRLGNLKYKVPAIVACVYEFYDKLTQIKVVLDAWPRKYKDGHKHGTRIIAYHHQGEIKIQTSLQRTRSLDYHSDMRS